MRMSSVWRWTLGLGIAFLGGLAWFPFGFGVAYSLSGATDVSAILVGILTALLPALGCLVAGWLIRSWWGMIAGAVVYAAISAFMWFQFIVSAGDTQAWLLAFPLYVALPGLAMAAIGTVIGLYRFGRGERGSQGGLAG